MFFPIRRVVLAAGLIGAALAAGVFAVNPQLRELVFTGLQQAGLPAFFLFTLLYNVLVVPFPYDVFLAATPWLYPSQREEVLVGAVAAVLAAAGVDYLLGRLLTRHGQRWFAGHKRYPQAMRALQHYGGWAVMLTAVTPLPFSLVCWVCGMARTSAGWFLLAVLLSRGLRTTVVWAMVWF